MVSTGDVAVGEKVQLQFCCSTRDKMREQKKRGEDLHVGLLTAGAGAVSDFVATCLWNPLPLTGMPYLA